jgi:Leucine-rich repeat (LRR) protein
VLTLNNNKLKAIPNCFSACKKLQNLSLNDN